MEQKNKEQELNVKFQILEQQIMAIQRQLQAVEQTLLDMASLKLGLDEIKKDKEILSQVGAGIFAKSKLISEELVVAIGEKNYIKKSIPETKKLIQEQIVKLEIAKESLEGELEKINEEVTRAMGEYQGKD